MRYEVCVFIPQVEQCLEYVHENISAVVASPCNMGCINDRLMVR